jgi:hypothetical protein
MKLILIMCLLAVTAYGNLEWEQKDVTLTVYPTQVSSNAVFRFSNTGNSPVTIKDVRVDCGCLSPALTRRTYAPGEKGELCVRFDLRDRTGPQRKGVVVWTTEGEDSKLFIECDIPEAFSFESKMILWPKGDQDKTKTIKLVNPNTTPIKLLSLTSSHAELPAQLKTVREGFEYEVVISNKTTSANTRSVIRIEIEPPLGLTEAKTLKFYVHVK